MVECFAMTWRSSLLKDRKDLWKETERFHVFGLKSDWEDENAHRHVQKHTYVRHLCPQQQHYRRATFKNRLSSVSSNQALVSVLHKDFKHQKLQKKGQQQHRHLYSEVAPCHFLSCEACIQTAVLCVCVCCFHADRTCISFE